MGGIEPARTLILKAISNGKSIITANKALLAQHGAELFSAADKAGVDLYYEASVGGAIPILRPMRESIVGDHVNRVMELLMAPQITFLPRWMKRDHLLQRY